MTREVNDLDDRATASHATPRCPRCGYDQRGVVATWIESCPLRSPCPECGLRINWSELLNPELWKPRWCVEFSIGRWRTVRAMIITLLRAYVPWTFWSQIRMVHPLEWRRLRMQILAALAAVYVVTAILHAATMYEQAKYFGASTSERISAAAVSLVLPSADFPVFHITRPWQVSLSPGRLLIDYFTTISACLRDDLFDAILLEQFHPLSIITAVATVVATLTSPMCLLLMPVSRRRARVRLVHLVRIAVYGTAILPPAGLLLMMTVLSYGAMAWFGRGALGFDDVGPVLALAGLLFPCWLFGWWWSVAACYLRLPHAPAVALAFTVLAYLLASTPMIGFFLLYTN